MKKGMAFNGGVPEAHPRFILQHSSRKAAAGSRAKVEVPL